MLIELFQLARNLDGQGIKTGLVHKDFGKPGLSTLQTLKAVLNEEGEVVYLRPISSDEVAGLWTLQSGNFKFFPAVRLTLFPELAIPTELLEKKVIAVDDVRQILKLAIESSSRQIASEMVDSASKNRQRIRDWKNIEDGEILGQLKKFSLAFDKFCATPEIAALRLLNGIENSLQTPCDERTLATLANLLAGKSFAGKKKEDEQLERKKKFKKNENRIQLCFDFRPNNDVSFTLYSPSVSRIVLECLTLEGADPTKKQAAKNAAADPCALTGLSGNPLTTPFPDWSAQPVINKPLTPFSKFSDAACNYRYQRADSDAFPIGVETARKLVAALKAITDKPQGTNWRALRNGKFDKQKERQDVLIAYPTMPLEDLPLVNLFAKPEANQEEGSKEFQDQARPVVEAFSKIAPSVQVPDYVVIFLIRQISSGQIQLAYSASPTRTEFISAVNSWNESARNLPFSLRVPLIPRFNTNQAPEKSTPQKAIDKTARWFTPRLLFPEEISRLLSRQWIRSGEETSTVEAPAVGQILDLFLRRPGVWQDIAANLLEVTLARTTVLLTHGGHVLHRDDPISLVKWSEFSLKSKAWPDYAFSQTLSLIGSLLYAMNSNVKNYVDESSYQIGRLLAMMDELHKCYCIAVRDGDIPNSLIGNGLLGRAADSPAQALAELGERSRIYLGWAKSVGITDTSEKAKKKNIAIHSARKVLRLAAPLCEQLHAEGSLDTEMSTAQKAHLFLGYLTPILGHEDEKDNVSEAKTSVAVSTTISN